MELTKEELQTLTELLKLLGVSRGSMYGNSELGWSAGGTATFDLSAEECCLVDKIFK